jgi:hypothetical protein
MAARDDAYQALFDRLQDAVQGITFFSRNYYDFDNVPSTPALLVVIDRQASEPSIAGTKWHLGANVLVYMKSLESGYVDTAINAVVDQIYSALRPLATEHPIGPHTTLGDVVLSAVPGDMQPYPGVPGDLTIALVPVSMMMANL